jgi:CheY-like chemotaxis protein
VANFSVCNSELIIKIQDNGPGIAEPIRERIFQPFFTTKEIGKGTGIGLSLVHSIVQEFRGRVECLESPFGGAEFRVSLPTEAEEPADVEPVKSSGLLEQKFSGRVLVVDDEEGVREFLLLLLSQLGVTVEAVSNGKQALDKIFLEGEVYDAVITDLTMPEMGGLEFVHKMQEEAEGQDQFHQPKVLLATGLPNFHFEEVSYPAVVGILNKPFSLQTLKENLTRLL